MRNTHVSKLMIAIAGSGLLAVIVVLSIVLLGRGAGESLDIQALASPTASPIPTAPPTVITPSPVPTPAASLPVTSFAGFKLEAVTGDIEFARPTSAEIPDDRTGVWFLDATTSELEGWLDNVSASDRREGLSFQPYAISGDNRFTVFQRQRKSVDPTGIRLADRATGSVYRLPAGVEPVLSESGQNGNVLATDGGRVLLRIAASNAFAVLDLDAEGRVTATFNAEGGWALFSEDGASVAVLDGVRLSIVDLRTGNRQQLDATIDGHIDLEGRIALQNSLDGSAFLLTASAVKQRFGSFWSQHGWDGRLLASGEGSHQVYPSPNGNLLALAEPLVAGEAPLETPWYVFNAIDARSGAALFRVAGVITHNGYTGGNRWLADGSGIVVSDPAFKLQIAMRDGSFRPYAGVPSPESALVFAAGSPVDGGPAVSDAAGNVLASAQPPARARSFVSPWGATDSEMRFITPHGGHGGVGFTLSLVQPFIERAPYSGPAALHLRPEAAGAALFDSPAGAQLAISLATPLRVSVQETKRVRLEPTQPGFAEHCRLLTLLSTAPVGADCTGVIWGTWARITTTSGQQGWLLVEVNLEGA